MIYITGDCHADFHKFSTNAFPEQKEMSRDDFLWMETMKTSIDFMAESSR
mgnify:CR=1 FL=1